MFEPCGNYQWAREFLMNSLEAGARRVEFGIEWLAVEKFGSYRRTIADDGAGMNGEELLEFFSTLGIGAKPIGGVHDNFGVGAKIASLPWNPDGVAVLSYKDGVASMIKIVLDPDSKEYELVEFESGDVRNCVLNPASVDWGDDVDWSHVAPKWVRQHGTVVVLLGSNEFPDTVLGDAQADERDIKGLSAFLNTRFWNLSDVQVIVSELRSEKKNAWPRTADDKGDSRPNNRQIKGAKYYLTIADAPQGKLAHKGTLKLDDRRVRARWYLWDGERPAVHSYAKKTGYIAVLYKDELFELSSLKHQFRNFGIIESSVQQKLTIILEPQLYEPPKRPWGVYPDQSRNRLIFTGNGDKGGSLPMSDWGLDFASHMPAEIQCAVNEARGNKQGTLASEEYRKRLQDKFGARWTMRALVTAHVDDTDVNHPATDTGQSTRFGVHLQSVRTRGQRKQRKTVQHVRLRVAGGGSERGVWREVPVDVPSYHYAGKDAFDHEWHLATWVPHDPEGPTVVLNSDAPLLLEAIKYHQDQYPPLHSEEIQKVVMDVYGEVAVAKVAHSQKLTTEVSEQELNDRYRSDEALTIALMGLLAEETLIAQRLGKLGRKKQVA